jgi:hypothetical protein
MNRRTAACVVALIFTALAAPAFAADVSQDNTTGVWKRNMAATNYPGGDPFTGMIMTRTAIPGGIRIDGKGMRKDGGNIDYTVDVIYDGKDHPVHGVGTPYDTLAITPVDANHQLSVTKKGLYLMHGVAEVSPDGKRMTISNKGVNAKGEPMNFTVVWDKQ